MIILGIDPGYAIVGIGVLEYKNGKFRPIEYNAITTAAQFSQSLRLKIIYEEIGAYLDKYTPSAVAIEELFFNSNQKTAIAVAQARGVLVAQTAVRGIPIYEYTPLQIKQALTGYGRADKKQIQEMVKRLLNLKKIPKPDDAADALAVALTHSNTSRFSSGFGIK